MNDAEEQSLKQAGKSLDAGDLQKSQGAHVISLLEVGRDFTNDPMSVAVFDVMPKVSDAQWDGKHWIVTLTARWTEQVTLDSTFGVISMRKIDN